MRLRSLIAVLLLFLAAPASGWAAWRAKADFTACGHGMPPSGEETFNTQSECQTRVAAVQPTMACGRYWCEEVGGGAAPAGSGDDLQQTTSKALAVGLVNGDSQTLGVGLLGLGVVALLDSSNSGSPPADLEAQRQAELDRQARIRAAQEAEAARKRKFDAEKREAIADLKGGDQDAAWQSADFDLKGDDLTGEDLKDAPHATPGEKTFSHLHLKPTPDPLHKMPRPEDHTGVTHLFDTWDEASACAGTTGKDTSSGKVACCPLHYPYYCGGQCYTETALDDLRIPCDSALRTDRGRTRKALMDPLK